MYARITENDHSANFDMDYINLQKNLKYILISTFLSESVAHFCCLNSNKYYSAVYVMRRSIRKHIKVVLYLILHIVIFSVFHCDSIAPYFDLILATTLGPSQPTSLEQRSGK